MSRISKSYALVALALAVMLVATMPVAANDIQGSLTRVDADNYHFTVVDQSGTTRDFRLRVDGQVLINDQERTLWDLRVGDRVQVTYQSESLELVATAIRCTRN